MPRLKPEAQSGADHHSRQPVAKPCKSLSPFLFSFFSSLSPTQHILREKPGKSAVHPSPLLLPLPPADLWSQPTVVAKCQITPIFPGKTREPRLCSKYRDSPSILDVTPCPAKVNGAVSDVLKNSKQPEKMSNSYELFKYSTDPSGLPESHENSTRWKVNRLQAGVFTHTHTHTRVLTLGPICLQCRQASNSAWQVSMSVSVDLIRLHILSEE